MSKKAGVAFSIGGILLAVGLTMILNHYSMQPDEELLGSGLIIQKYGVENAMGQHVVSVPIQELGAWVKQYNKAKIVSIVSVNDGPYGHTTAFIVVYEVGVPVEFQGPHGD